MIRSMTDVLHKTLVIRLSSIGDIVLSSLLVRVLRSRFPACRLDYCVKEEFADLVRLNPNISNVITFPKHGGFGDVRKLMRTIRENDYDLIIDIHDSLRSRFLHLGAARVVRINKRKLARFLLVKFKWNVYGRFGGSPGVALRYLEPLRPFGIEDDGKGLELFIAENDRQRTEQLIREAGFGQEQFIGVCPSAKHHNKMWLKERFAETASVLSIGRQSPVVLFGSGDEAERCNAIANLIREQNPQAGILNLAGRISLNETAAMMDRCSIVITNDSGLMHIAAARKRKVVAIFGPTVKELGFFPFGTQNEVIENTELECRPCTHIGLADCPKGHFKCMNDISAAQVIASANRLLQTQ